VIILEGADRSGKSTLKDLFNEATGFRHVVIDRAFISCYVYARSRRETDCWRHLEMLAAVARQVDLIVFHVKASKEELKKRGATAREMADADAFDAAIEGISGSANVHTIINNGPGPEVALKQMLKVLGSRPFA